MNKRALLPLIAGISSVACVTVVVQSQSGNLFVAEAGECHHTDVKHYETLDPTLSKAGHKEYWACCECHKSFKDSAFTEEYENVSFGWTDPSDERYLAPIGTEMSSNIMYSGSESEEAAPEGYAFNKVFEQSGYQGQFIFNNYFNVQDYEKISFAVKGGVWFILRGSWDTAYAPNKWYVFDLEQTSNGVWSIYSSEAGGERALKYSGVEAVDIKNLTGFGGESSTYLLTNLRVAEKAQEIASSSSVSEYVVSDMVAPAGYKTVKKSAETYGEANQSNDFLSDIAMDKYDVVTFAFMTKNRKFSLTGWRDAVPMDAWNYVRVIRNSDDTFTSQITTADGVVKTNLTNAKTFRASMPYYNFDGDAPEMEWYSTEVKGILREVVAPSTVLINDNVICGNGATVTVANEAAPEGFTKVGYWAGGDNMHGMLYSGTPLTSYSSVTFALKTSGYFLFDGWGTVVGDCTWIVFELTNNNDDTWNMVAKNLKGDTIYTADALTSFKGEDPGVYTNYALNTILYGNPGTGYAPAKKDGHDTFVYATELRGTYRGSIIAESALGGNGASSLMRESAVARPSGYNNVYELDGSGTLHGQYYSDLPLTGYDYVRFAMMTSGTFYLDSWDVSVGSNEWIFFELVNTGEYTWNLRATLANGQIKRVENGMSSYKGEDPGVYTNGALNALLYGIPGVGFFASGEPVTIYATEIIAE